MAVDGGLQRIHELKLSPHLIIGDLDSLDIGLLQCYPAVPCLKYASEKNETDTELALMWCRENGYQREIIICNDLQGRFDHALALVQNLLQLQAEFAASGLVIFPSPLRIESESQVLFCLPREICFPHQQNCLLSLIPLSVKVEIISSIRLKYPLDGLTLWQHQSRGISNEITAADARIIKGEGEVLAVLSVPKG